jgi:hypothetical protein
MQEPFDGDPSEERRMRINDIGLRNIIHPVDQQSMDNT